MDGSFPVIRPARDSDAAALLQLARLVFDGPDNFHLLTREELVQSDIEQAKIIAWYQAASNRCLLVCEGDNQTLAGQATAFAGTYEADRGTALVIVEVAPDKRRRGIATQLLRRLDLWARDQGIHRLELTLLPENSAALALYQKCGYELEGRKRSSRRLRGRFHDELIMAKLF